jgi:anti-sigma regulatory factor (Ser/Thr protein kinase)
MPSASAVRRLSDLTSTPCPMDTPAPRAALATALVQRRFVLENEPALVAPLIEVLAEDLVAVGVCDKHDATRVGIALEEALLNAIYHGNLELSSSLKESGDDTFHQLARARRFQFPYAARRVRLAARVTPERATYVIADMGKGFDVNALPDPTAPEFLERPSGRGLLLMRAFTDDVRYNATGTRVTLVKRYARER